MKVFRWIFAHCLLFSHQPYLNSRVHVIVDVIVFQHTMAIVIEVDPNLFKWQWNIIHLFIPRIKKKFRSKFLCDSYLWKMTTDIFKLVNCRLVWLQFNSITSHNSLIFASGLLLYIYF